MGALGFPEVSTRRASDALHNLAVAVPELTSDYVVKEVEYLLGRFEPENLEAYINAERTGRGAMPRVDRNLRRRILDDVVYPYLNWLSASGFADWNQIAIRMAREVAPISYDVLIVDESQDFSANQLRAIRRHLADHHAITFVIDTIQRIYARGFTWSEAGFDVRPERVHTLHANHRNTVEIAGFAASILSGMRPEADGVLPNLAAATTNGPMPKVLRGLYRHQLNWAIDYIQRAVDLTTDSVAFLKPRPGTWFEAVEAELGRRGLPYADITRNPDWPDGDANIALSTFHSAKGLEFDYVFILGLADKNTPFADESVDDQVHVLRRLLAVAVARARKEVVLGYKPGEETRLTQYFGPGTYEQIEL
jgi:superfamily I DNA/RNA helicase